MKRAARKLVREIASTASCASIFAIASTVVQTYHPSVLQVSCAAVVSCLILLVLLHTTEDRNAEGD